MEKRLFFGLEVHAPWPEDLPQGRLINEKCRHMTIAFLGNTNFESLQLDLQQMPKIPWKIGFVGMFDRCLLLPPRHPNVIAWHIKWLEDETPLNTFQKDFTQWLQNKNYMLTERREFLHHTTLCRKPFQSEQWKQNFSPLPLYVINMHLYESTGNLNYRPCWTFPINEPFNEIEHTADIAYLVHGENLLQLYIHAFTALAFHFPSLLSFFHQVDVINSLEDIIKNLNFVIFNADKEIGCPMKAVSFHGNIKERDNILTWEMIVDV